MNPEKWFMYNLMVFSKQIPCRLNSQSSFPGHTGPNDARNCLLCLTHDFLLQAHYFFSTWTCFGPAQSPTIVFKASPWKFLKIQKPLKVRFLFPSSFEKKTWKRDWTRGRDTENKGSVERVWEEESRAKIRRRDKWTKMDGFKRCRQFVSVQLIPGIYPLSLIPFLSSLSFLSQKFTPGFLQETEDGGGRKRAKTCAIQLYTNAKVSHSLVLPKNCLKKEGKVLQKRSGKMRRKCKSKCADNKTRRRGHKTRKYSFSPLRHLQRKKRRFSSRPPNESLARNITGNNQEDSSSYYVASSFIQGIQSIFYVLFLLFLSWTNWTEKYWIEENALLKNVKAEKKRERNAVYKTYRQRSLVFSKQGIKNYGESTLWSIYTARMTMSTTREKWRETFLAGRVESSQGISRTICSLAHLSFHMDSSSDTSSIKCRSQRQSGKKSLCCHPSQTSNVSLAGEQWRREENTKRNGLKLLLQLL